MNSGTTVIQALALSPMCHVRPHPNPPNSDEIIRAVNVFHTGSCDDQSQKNFELIMMSVGLATPFQIISTPVPVEDLSAFGGDLSGPGFEWKFRIDSCPNFTVADLSSSVDGTIIHSGIRATTRANHHSGVPLNLSFKAINDNL